MNRLLLSILLLIAATVAGSWLLSVAGFDVPNLLSAEGIRWMFRLRPDEAMVTRFEVLVSLVVVAGAVLKSGLFNHLHELVPSSQRDAQRLPTLRQRRALWLSLITAVSAISLLLLFVCLPDSPLRSATGRLWPSPFLHGLLQTVVVILVATCAVYGATSRHLRTLSDFAALFYHGIQRFAPLLLIWYLAELWFSLLITLIIN